MPTEEIEHNPPGAKGLPLLPTLLFCIGLLVLLAVGSVFLLQWFTGRLIIQEFASRLIARNLYALELALRENLDAAVHQASFIAEAIEAERFALSDPGLENFIAGSIAAAPQIGAVIIADSEGKALRLLRGASDVEYQLDRLNLAEDDQLAEMASEVRSRSASYWGEPAYRDLRKITFLSYRVPIRKEEAYVGLLAIAISTKALSEVTAELSDPPERLAFMLYGHDWVLAHPLMTVGSFGQSQQSPLPSLAALGDLVIENFRSQPEPLRFGVTPPSGANASSVSIEGKRYLIFTTEVSGYVDLPITIGMYLLASAVDAPIRQFYWATVIALALFGGSLIATALIVGMISRPIRRAAIGAAAIGTLDFDKVEPLPQSIFREISDLARSFNSMLDGLKAFGRYVPRTLVLRLIQEGRVGTRTEERKLAVMFTDIAGFTTACEDKSAVEVAEFINHHLALVSGCIEHESGTIDKYIGDAVMAFWGAPNRVENPAACACRAAIAIWRALSVDNAQRVDQGLKPIQVRIGIHFGPVVVGDIGAPNRINYTIVGDTVNAAQRLESLGKVVDPKAEVIVLISRQVMTALPNGFNLIDRGAHLVKGKHDAMEVFQLVGEPISELEDTIELG